MCCVTNRPEYPPLLARHQPRIAAPMLLTVASANTKSTEARRSGKRRDLPANSRSGARRTRAIGRCTANGWQPPRNCAGLARSNPSGGRKTIRTGSTRIGTRVRSPRRVLKGILRSDACTKFLSLLVAVLCAIEATGSRQDLCHDPCRFHAREFLFQPLERVVELTMIEAQHVKHGGMQIANLHRVLHNFIAHCVGLTQGHTRLDSAPRHPDGERTRVVVAAGKGHDLAA